MIITSFNRRKRPSARFSIQLSQSLRRSLRRPPAAGAEPTQTGLTNYSLHGSPQVQSNRLRLHPEQERKVHARLHVSPINRCFYAVQNQLCNRRRSSGNLRSFSSLRSSKKNQLRYIISSIWPVYTCIDGRLLPYYIQAYVRYAVFIRYITVSVCLLTVFNVC